MNESVKREIHGYATQIGQQLATAIATRMEAEDSPVKALRESLEQRKQRRGVIALEMAKVLRSNDPYLGNGIDDPEADSKQSKKIMSVAVMDAENLLADLELSEKADDARFKNEVEKIREESTAKPRIVRPDAQ